MTSKMLKPYLRAVNKDAFGRIGRFGLFEVYKPSTIPTAGHLFRLATKAAPPINGTALGVVESPSTIYNPQPLFTIHHPHPWAHNG